MKNILILISLLLWTIFDLRAQTCCSGGVPIAANIGLPSGDKGTLQFTLNYDLNVLKTLKDGTRELQDGLRERKTHSILFGVSYGITNRLSVDGFLSHVTQERLITPAGLPSNLVRTNGIGDAVILAKYKLTNPEKPSTQLVGGLGVKLPTGASDLANNNITLNADLQPGSGAWDGILWANFIQNIKFRRSMNFISTITFRITGENDDYFGTQVYELGDELQIRAGVSDRVTIGDLILDPSLSFRYRHAAQDINDGNDLPNTGGEWIFIIPAVSYNIGPDFSVNATAELPLFARVDGTQLSPSFRLNFGLFYKLNTGGKKNFDILKLQEN
ncbi:hypothetical protein QQ020_31350 [Fulvivirgaceae bacterium BMA12]|uniref:Transporter n=1 Tax=Agaribacillus aureus TaxID=3051825 RepID=A0ABT8LGB3_9BACT|nr:hypothetical protein [Fulvivirgaceae bacterium BMA12]